MQKFSFLKVLGLIYILTFSLCASAVDSVGVKNQATERIKVVVDGFNTIVIEPGAMQGVPSHLKATIFLDNSKRVYNGKFTHDCMVWPSPDNEDSDEVLRCYKLDKSDNTYDQYKFEIFTRFRQ